MLILQHTPHADDLLDFIDQSVRNLAETGGSARYILMGPMAFSRFKASLAARLHREEKDFGTYNYLPVVVDPFRNDEVCVLPEAREVAAGVEAVNLP